MIERGGIPRLSSKENGGVFVVSFGGAMKPECDRTCDKVAYSYTLLRYVHDVLTGEFLNVGVVLVVPIMGRVLFKACDTADRLKGAFPDFDEIAFWASMDALHQSLKLAAGSNLAKSGDTTATIARYALLHDDSSLQWSPPGAGLAADPDRTLNRLFARFVTRYDART